MPEHRSYQGEIIVPAEFKQLTAVMGLIDNGLKNLNFPLTSWIHVKIAVDEIFSNIIKHTDLLGGGDVKVLVRTETDPGAIVITFIDRGRPFNPLLAEEPDVTVPAKKRRIGGLGLLMVRRLMDSVEYEYKDEQNILTIRKNL